MLYSPARRLACFCATFLVLQSAVAAAADLPVQERAVAVLALPYQPGPAINRLFSALWNLPTALVSGPVAALRKKGGTFQIQSDGRGLIVMAEGPAELSDAVKLAVQNFAEGEFASRMVPRAKATVLKNDALTVLAPGARAEEHLWELFYGKSTSSNALKAEDTALLRLDAADIKAFQEKLRQQKAIFYGNGQDLQPSSFLPALPQHQPGPDLLRVEVPHLAEPRLLLGQPLPPLVALRHAPGKAWVESVRANLADLGASVRLSFRPGSVLLVLDLPLRGQSPADLRQAVSQRLGKIGGRLPLPGIGTIAAPGGQMPVPERAAKQLHRKAEDHLLFGRTPAAMTERLWAEAWGLVTTPEAMRGVWLVPAQGE